MVFARLQGEFKIGTEKRAATLGNEFFAGIAFIAPALAPDDKSFTLEQHRTGKRSEQEKGPGSILWIKAKAPDSTPAYLRLRHSRLRDRPAAPRGAGGDQANRVGEKRIPAEAGILFSLHDPLQFPRRMARFYIIRNPPCNSVYPTIILGTRLGGSTELNND